MGIFYILLTFSFTVLFFINVVWAGINFYFWSLNGIQFLLEGMNFAEKVYGSIFLKWILLADLGWLIIFVAFLFGRRKYKTDMKQNYLEYLPIINPKISMILIAFNEEPAIEKVVKDFLKQKNVKEEILCYGLRNPWRFSFDLLTGDLFIGDVGQNNWEEIDVILANKMGGQNFGWNIMEGFHCYPEEIECNNTNLIEPIWEYPNNANYFKTLAGIKQTKMDGCSITGGYVYRGNKIPEFYGRYIFGDYCTGKVWSFIYENGETKNIKNHTLEILNSMNKNSFYLSSFGETIDGELLIVDYNGGIYIITSL